ncbi:MAG TPA: thiolase family protein [Actinomycetota bacterium]|nr:thiolase family protein [Actinomycetota bacterium]
MRYERAYVPSHGAWSSPFVRWQGPLAEVSSLDLVVYVTRRALQDRGVPPHEISQLVLGWTVPQQGSFYGAPTVAGRIGAPGVTGPMVSQACATSIAAVSIAASALESGDDGLHLALLTDRTSNGPHIVYPSPSNRGGTVRSEDWVMDNFACDPWAGEAMVRTAENVAAETGITRDEMDQVTLLRYEQYQRALEDDRAFQRGYMVPVEIPQTKGDPLVIAEDVGIYPTTRESLANLRPVEPGGLVTFGSQTHPADGTAGILVCGEGRARALSQGEGIVRILASAFARVEKARMPKAAVPAARRALSDAGLRFADLDAITTHNPFAVNDIYFSQETSIPLEDVNLWGCSLVYGHPQGPTGARAIAELIETLRFRGGGTGLFTGCAAGDTGAAMIVRVED